MIAIKIRGCTTYTAIQPYNRHNYPREPKGFLRLTGAEREKAKKPARIGSMLTTEADFTAHPCDSCEPRIFFGLDCIKGDKG